MWLRRSEEDLSVCQTESTPRGTICDHIFHKTCLKASLNTFQHCPNCQTNLPIEDIFGHILTRQQT
uniref:RING-type domain-containing protein n=1 Tax=Glossina palpalis gambiensis TaxID=67801 RepID=A0A1B0BVY4_9MUSC